MDTRLLQELAPLLCVAQRCEELARDIAMQQAAIAPLPRLARALHHQSRHEAFHARLFHGAVQCIPGHHRCPPRLAAAVAAYQSRLQADVSAGNLHACMCGLQCAFEGLAAAMLQPPPGPLAAVCDRLIPLRALILRQEEAHHRIGEWWSGRLRSSSIWPPTALHAYAELAEEIAAAGLSELETLHVDRSHYGPAIDAHLASVRARCTSGVRGSPWIVQ